MTDVVRAALDAGMAAQRAELEHRLARGIPRLGWKVGFNDEAVQRRLGIEGFLVATLDGSRRHESGQICTLTPGSSPCVEAEVGVRMARDLAPGATSERALAAIAALAPAIEVVDYARPSNGLEAILRHAIFHAASVIGADHPLDAFGQLENDVPRLVKNGAIERVPEPTLRIVDLGAVVARVATILGSHSLQLRAGDWVLTGSWVKPAPVAKGDEVEVAFGSLGSVRVRFPAS